MDADATTQETQAYQQVSGTSVFWAVVALALYATTQSSSLWPGTMVIYDSSISPQRCSPVNCILDAYLDTRLLVRNLKTYLRNKNRNKDNDDTDPSSGEAETDNDPPQRSASAALIMVVFLLAALSQAVKVFCMRGARMSQVYVSIFLVAILTRATLYYQVGPQTKAKSTSLARLRRTDKLVVIAEAVQPYHGLSYLIHILWYAFVWCHFGKRTVRPLWAAGKLEDVYIVTMWYFRVWAPITCCMMLAVSIRPRLAGSSRYPPPAIVLWPAHLVMRWLDAVSRGSKHSNGILLITDLGLPPLLTAAACCFALAYIANSSVHLLYTIRKPKVLPLQETTAVHGDLNVENQLEAPAPAPGFTDMIESFDDNRRWLVQEWRGISVNKAFIVDPDSLRKTVTRGLHHMVHGLLLVLLTAIYIVWSYNIAAGPLALLDLCAVVSYRSKPETIWMTFMLFNLVTAGLGYSVFFNAEGTYTPDWTSFLG